MRLQPLLMGAVTDMFEAFNHHHHRPHGNQQGLQRNQLSRVHSRSQSVDRHGDTQISELDEFKTIRIGKAAQKASTMHWLQPLLTTAW